MLIYLKRLLPLSSDLNSNNRAPVGCWCCMPSPFLNRWDWFIIPDQIAYYAIYIYAIYSFMPISYLTARQNSDLPEPPRVGRCSLVESQRTTEWMNDEWHSMPWSCFPLICSSLSLRTPRCPSQVRAPRDNMGPGPWQRQYGPALNNNHFNLCADLHAPTIDW